MSKVNIEYKYYTKIYSIIWLIMVASLIVLRKSVLLGASEDTLFNTFITYALLTWIPIMIIGMYEGSRLTTYLKVHHHRKYEDLTSAFGMKTGWNGFKIISFVLSNENLNNLNVKRLKSIYRRFLLFSLIVFCLFPLIFVYVLVFN